MKPCAISTVFCAAEGVNYRTFRGRDANQPKAIPFRHPEGDRIVLLEDIESYIANQKFLRAIFLTDV